MLLNYRAKLGLPELLRKIVVICIMKILVIAATGAEIALSIKHITASGREVKPLVFYLDGVEISFSVTGVGMVATAYHLTKLLAIGGYDLVIQAGIAGCFDRDIPLGEVLMVQSDRFADLGAEDGDSFTDVFDLGLAQANDAPFAGKILSNPQNAAALNIQLKEVNALTVNTVTGNDESTARLQNRYDCTLETMEGAAFHYVCLQENIPFVQIRAVSNYVERRNRVNWKIEEAINNLNNYLIDYLENKLNK